MCRLYTLKQRGFTLAKCHDLHFPMHISSSGTSVLGAGKLRERPGHFDDKRKPKGFDTKQVFVSPSIRYAGHEAYASSER